MPELARGPIWEIDGPATLAGRRFEIGIGVDREAVPGDAKHIGVPAGIAKGGVDLLLDDIAQRLRLARPGGYSNQSIRDHTVIEFDFRREDSVFGNAEGLHAGANHPLV
jgi:hypothetical protein